MKTNRLLSISDINSLAILQTQATIFGLQEMNRSIEDILRYQWEKLDDLKTAKDEVPTQEAAPELERIEVDVTTSPAPKKRELSPSARKRLSAAQKRRWKAYHAKTGGKL